MHTDIDQALRWNTLPGKPPTGNKGGQTGNTQKSTGNDSKRGGDGRSAPKPSGDRKN